MGATHTCATDTGGTLYCWGTNPYGQTGNGLSDTRQNPVAVRGLLTGKKVTHFSISMDRTCAVADGSLYCWGRGNAGGTMGDTAGTAESKVPLLIDGGALKGVAVESSKLTTFVSCALSVAGKAYCWGGLVPPGTDDTQPAAVDMSAVEGGKLEQLGVGNGFACGVGASKAYCWAPQGHIAGGNPGWEFTAEPRGP